MNKKILFVCSVLFIFGAIINFSACTGDFEELNHDSFAISEKELEHDFRLVGEPFVNMIRNIYIHKPIWKIQLQQNLIGDVYSGYMMPPTPFAGNSNNMNYNLLDGWITEAWNPAYKNVMSSIKYVESKAGTKFPEFIAWSKIIKVAAMHRVTDMFGPIIYTKFGEVELDGSILYDCQDVVYDAFFRDLDAAVETLTELVLNSGNRPFAIFDEVYEGDINKWVKFANSLRLRLAIRISKVDPIRAKIEAEKATNHLIGVITENDENFIIKNNISHPLNTINNAWNDVRMGAPIESILSGFNDPRLGVYFRKSKIDPNNYKGIRIGIDINSKGDYVVFSALQNLRDVQLMGSSEVYFLKSEGALKGWDMGGTAQEFYELGITKSFEQNGLLGANTYMLNMTDTPIQYVDPVNSVNNVRDGSPYLSTITIGWLESDSNERKLERIITQKWIGLFPDGQEAWSEYRRTGYPILFPVVINNSGGEIDTDAQIKRIKYISNQYIQNPMGVAGGVSCLGGPDTGGTPLWWDVD